MSHILQAPLVGRGGDLWLDTVGRMGGASRKWRCELNFPFYSPSNLHKIKAVRMPVLRC